MPWRTIVEIVKYFQSVGHEVKLFSANRTNALNAGKQICDEITFFSIVKDHKYIEQLSDHFREFSPEIVFYPFSWWRVSKDSTVLAKVGANTIAYIPGANYRFMAVVRAVPFIGVRAAFPYLAQSLYPTRFLVRGLELCRIKQIITMTDDTRSALVRGGWHTENIHTVWPAYERPNVVNQEETPVFSRVMEKIGGQPFFLFFSPPTPIRGIDVLLDAFKRAHVIKPNIHLVCLFRSDSNVNQAQFQKKYNCKKLNSSIHAVWGSVAHQELAAFISAAYAVTLPFLLVPSEIPLAVIEAASHGTPVISTGPSGTGDFISAYGLQVPVGDSAALAQAMLHMLTDDDFHQACRRAALKRYSACSSWQKVGQKWLEIGVANVN